MSESSRTIAGAGRALGFSTLLRALFVALAVATPFSAAKSESLTLFLGGDAAPIELTLADLEAMPQTTIETENEFVDGIVSYRGPLARDVILPFDPDRSTVLRFTAANDYAIDIPATDFLDFDVILAMQADGKKMSRREKGPLWLMYPITEHPEFRGRPYSDRLIWQVVSIEAR